MVVVVGLSDYCCSLFDLRCHGNYNVIGRGLWSCGANSYRIAVVLSETTWRRDLTDYFT